MKTKWWRLWKCSFLLAIQHHWYNISKSSFADFDIYKVWHMVLIDGNVKIRPPNSTISSSVQYFCLEFVKIDSLSSLVVACMLRTLSSSFETTDLKLDRIHRVAGRSPIRLSPIGHSPTAKVHGCIGESKVDFRQLAKFQEIYWRNSRGCVGESKVDFTSCH
jgi:hypothetical protein